MTKQKIKINLTDDKRLTEGWYTQFAYDVRSLLFDLHYAGFDVPLSLTGTQEQINSFFRALKGEKRYMDSYTKHGLADARTLEDRHQLMKAVRAFEKETGLRWPFKN